MDDLQPIGPTRHYTVVCRGRDVGLVTALNLIVTEQTRQDAAADAALDQHQHSDAARHQYGAGRLLAVG
jgi:hypothetical protein